MLIVMWTGIALLSLATGWLVVGYLTARADQDERLPCGRVLRTRRP